ncbi:MAG TPA: hypothetical protein H9784_07695 [Candidatus Desulfovibrio intestinavium]|uniref:Magnesium transporter MgtE intracellular domain-containing protein n=1 Tax=Candidatus Desulfovibrio intestinavium TaxID=2838534 RepID=A0A9D2HM42_9BACT|nr:hypothetical protein [Candidatus Desulfovibrio intestinavium]
MTKSPHSATRLRLFKLYRLLAMLCIFKLCLLGALLLDMDWRFLDGTPGRNGSGDVALETDGDVERVTAALQAGDDAVVSEKAVPQALAEAAKAVAEDAEGAPQKNREPQGLEAALLAAEARPVARPAPLATGLDGSVIADGAAGPAVSAGDEEKDSPFTRPPKFSEPPLLDAGLAGRSRPRESGIMDMLGLSNLPIPRLGSVKAAHAAAQDMPVPAVSERGGNTPFAPAAQQNATVMPGAPAIPANIPRGEDVMARQGATLPGDAADLPALPQSPTTVARPPAPSVRPMTLPDDPNEKAQDLARQEQDMLVLRQQMDQRLKELEGAEKRMQSLIRDARSLEDQKVRSLIQMYANMKPRVAAKALENMDERVAVRILSGMAPKQSGEILTYTNPEKTAKFTEIITRMRTP